eukprot:m.25205 g.25205  ORF g.25205 m.25205 type:complete len:85 (+) comp14914_c0_seq1:3449-3703(+)
MSCIAATGCPSPPSNTSPFQHHSTLHHPTLFTPTKPHHSCEWHKDNSLYVKGQTDVPPTPSSTRYYILISGGDVHTWMYAHVCV